MDDHYYAMDTETVPESKTSVKSRVGAFFKNFFLAIAAIGLLVLLVFQIFLISSTAEVKA
jgi:hypothetical protein